MSLFHKVVSIKLDLSTKLCNDEINTYRKSQKGVNMFYQDLDVIQEDVQDTIHFLQSLEDFQATNQLSSMKGQYIG